MRPKRAPELAKLSTDDKVERSGAAARESRRMEKLQ